MTIAVQINGKLRHVKPAADLPQEETTRAALAEPAIARHLGGQHHGKLSSFPMGSEHRLRNLLISFGPGQGLSPDFAP